MTPFGRPVVIFAVACAAASCATLPACPSKGGPTWRELTSAHFRVRSDLDPEDAKETVRRLEELRASMLATLWPGAPEPPNRTEVVVLRSHIEFLVFAGEPTLWGVRSERSPLPPLLVFGGSDDRAVSVVAHELAHDISRWYLPLQPAWFSEGIATFLETLRYDRRNGRAEVGAPSTGRYFASLGLHRLSAAKLLATTSEPSVQELGNFEASAWLLTHYLINKRPRDFARLQGELGRLKSTAEAWSIAFPDLPPDKLDAALSDYSRVGRYAMGELSLRVPEMSVAIREMADAEVHATWALLFATVAMPGSVPDDAATRREIVEAIAADATNLEVLAFSFFWFTPAERRADREELSRRATSAHPDAALAWLMAASVAHDESAERTALARALRLEPNQAHVVVEFARLNAATARWSEALAFSTEAMHLGERHWTLLALHMRALAHVGRCPDAAYFVEALKSAAPPAAAEAASREWGSLRASCAESALAPLP